MSRSYNKHHESWNHPKRLAKLYSKKNRRRYGKILINKIEKGKDENMPVDVPKNAGAGDIWGYD